MLSFAVGLSTSNALDPCDMRAGADTLHALVGDRLKEDSRSGTLSVFTNRRREIIKVLHWDRTGMGLMTRRNEQGILFWPRAAQEGQVKLELGPEAGLFTDGIDMHGAKPRGWYERG